MLGPSISSSYAQPLFPSLWLGLPHPCHLDPRAVSDRRDEDRSRAYNPYD